MFAILTRTIDIYNTKTILSRSKWFAIGAVLLALLTMPLWGSQSLLLLFLLIALYTSFGQMWNLIGGYAGLASLGQQIFIGLGGYTLAVLTEYYGLPIWLSILIGGLICGLFAIVMAVLLFRMKGVYFTIATLITAEALVVLFSNWSYVRQGIGFFIRTSYKLSTWEIYYAALALGLGSIILVYVILRSKLGLGLMAMRDNEGAAETMGVEIFKSKLYCFFVSAVITGFTGAVFFLFQVVIQPYSAFGISWTVAVVFIVIIGGIGTIEGPVVGAVLYVILQQFLAQYAGISMVVMGVLAIAVLLVAPRGIMGTIEEKFNFRIFSTKRV